jgi:hypothetical protein
MHCSENSDLSSQIKIGWVDFFPFDLDSSIVSVSKNEHECMSFGSSIYFLINKYEFHKPIARIIAEPEPKGNVACIVDSNKCIILYYCVIV